jgi:prepilin-type N-terminal cleavage/methylation domain-containing protein
MNAPVQPRVFPARGSRGFTLLEILVALALVGLVLVGLNTFIFSMGELWGRRSEVRLFDQHVRAVSRFLERELRRAVWPPESAPGQPGISVRDVRPRSGSSGPLLRFELRDGSRLIAWPGQPLPEVVCALAVRDGTGLVLLWQSRLETRFGDDPPRETVISPLVTAIQYDYYDAETRAWRTEPSPRRNRENADRYDAPRRLRLTFKHGAATQETVITVPLSVEGIATY